ncbi:hypothetical protein WNY37_15655 [Henriciella sp. AS95]|uniref:hypothetical protein n=1 Tax=Henriciella sp. AS95 TaxID=3135782 RepID=UPI0031781F6C
MESSALDLAEIDPPQWRVLVNGSVYGPYTLGQMQGFIRERRILEQTRVACGDGGAFTSASDHEGLSGLFGALKSPAEDAGAEPANYLVIARLAATGEMQLISALNRLGKFAEVMPGVWALRSTARQARIRDRIHATIGSTDQVMIANATTGRLAWLNLGPEADIHIKTVWDAKIS